MQIGVCSFGGLGLKSQSRFKVFLFHKFHFLYFFITEEVTSWVCHLPRMMKNFTTPQTWNKTELGMLVFLGHLTNYSETRCKRIRTWGPPITKSFSCCHWRKLKSLKTISAKSQTFIYPIHWQNISNSISHIAHLKCEWCWQRCNWAIGLFRWWLKLQLTTAVVVMT